LTRVFAISGGQTLGKTTLCHELSWELKRRGLSAGYIQEAVRRSQFMFKGDRGIKMHIETLFLHIIEEVTGSVAFDILVCDRSAVDYLAYANLRFGRNSGDVLYDTVRASVSSYCRSYEKIFVLRSSPVLDDVSNFREGENTAALDVSDECIEICREFGVPYELVELPPGPGRSQFVLSSILASLGEK
jgi:predicted ATPase